MYTREPSELEAPCSPSRKVLHGMTLSMSRPVITGLPFRADGGDTWLVVDVDGFRESWRCTVQSSGYD